MAQPLLSSLIGAHSSVVSIILPNHSFLPFFHSYYAYSSVVSFILPNHSFIPFFHPYHTMQIHPGEHSFLSFIHTKHTHPGGKYHTSPPFIHSFFHPYYANSSRCSVSSFSTMHSFLSFIHTMHTHPGVQYHPFQPFIHSILFLMWILYEYDLRISATEKRRNFS